MCNFMVDVTYQVYTCISNKFPSLAMFAIENILDGKARPAKGGVGSGE